MSLESTLQSRYGVSGLEAPVYAIIWAAEHMAQTNKREAQKQLSALNRKRERAGKSPAYPDYHSPLFRRNMASKRKVRRRVAKALTKYVRGNAGRFSIRKTKKRMKGFVKRGEYGFTPEMVRGLIKARKRRPSEKRPSQRLANPPRVKGRKTKGGRAVTVRNFTGTIIKKFDGTVQIVGRGKRK